MHHVVSYTTSFCVVFTMVFLDWLTTLRVRGREERREKKRFIESIHHPRENSYRRDEERHSTISTSSYTLEVCETAYLTFL